MVSTEGREGSCLFSGRGEEPATSREIVLPDPSRDIAGRIIRVVSFRGIGESRPMGCPGWGRRSAVVEDSATGTGDGAAEPLAAAVAFRT